MRLRSTLLLTSWPHVERLFGEGPGAPVDPPALWVWTLSEGEISIERAPDFDDEQWAFTLGDGRITITRAPEAA